MASTQPQREEVRLPEIVGPEKADWEILNNLSAGLAQSTTPESLQPVFNKVPKKPGSGLPLIARVLRSGFIQKFLYPLEKTTRDRPFLADGTKVAVARSLTQPLLDALFSNEILGIHIPGWYDSALCERVARNVSQLTTQNWNVYDVKEGYKKSDVDVVGHPFNMAVLNDERWNAYFSGMRETTLRIRSVSGEASGPLDRFRLEMDEVWPAGLAIRTFRGAKMIPGLIRVMRDDAGPRTDIPVNCHVDDSPLLSARHGRYSVNVYLKPPREGGELYLWNTRMEGLGSVFKYWYLNKNFFLSSSYANEDLQRQFQRCLPPPVRLKVCQGDLVILNTGRPHAIAPFSGGPRISMQAFLTYRKNKPIAIWA